MPATRQPENPFSVLRALEQRVRILEQASRPASFTGVQVVKNSDQVVPTGLGSMSIVTFASVDFDSDGFFDDGNDQFLVPDDLDGYYSLYAKVDWEDGTGAVRTRIEFNNDFANINNAESWAESTSGSDTTGYVHIVRYMNAGDLIHLKVAHNQGTDRSVIGTGDAHGSYFGIAFLGM